MLKGDADIHEPVHVRIGGSLSYDRRRTVDVRCAVTTQNPRARDRDGHRFSLQQSQLLQMQSLFLYRGLTPLPPSRNNQLHGAPDIRNTQCDMHGLLRDGEIYRAVTASVGQVSN